MRCLVKHGFSVINETKHRTEAILWQPHFYIIHSNIVVEVGFSMSLSLSLVPDDDVTEKALDMCK